MRQSESHIAQVRGLRYHVRSWGSPAAPQLWLLHGWMDMSASFQFVVDALQRDWFVLAPDWRGFGLTQWCRDGYWFPDYLADLDALLDAFAGDVPVNLIGHSMGGNVANLYAGVRPRRIRRLGLLEGFGLPRTQPADSPARYGKWLDELKEPATLRSYATLEDVAARLMRNNPRLSAEKAAFLATHWARRTDAGDWELLGDPAHKHANPVLYRIEEAMACWRRIEAPVLWVWGDGAWVRKWFKTGDEDLAERRAAFSRLTEVRLADCGHMMHHDQPEKLAGVIEAFIE